MYCSLPLDEYGTSCCFLHGLYCSLSLNEFGTSCCFPQGGKSSICIFVAARPVWNVVPFSSGRKDLVCLLSLNWTSCLTSRHSTNLERRAVFSRENILLFVLLSSLDEFGTSCWNVVLVGEQGWCSGESARLPPMCPGFDSRTRRHMWAEFVGSLLCSERFFSGNSGFPLSSKTNI